MFTLKAFATHYQFINNANPTVSAVGELSPQSSTFSRNKGNYKSPMSVDIDLITFTSILGTVQHQLTVDMVDDIVTIVKNVYDSSLASAILDRTIFLQDLLTAFGIKAFNFSCGNIVTNGIHSIPEWVSWESKNITDIGAGNVIKIWLADASFQAQYDDYEVVIVPPVAAVDNFFKPATDVLIDVNAITPSMAMDNVQLAKNGFVETAIRTKVFNFIDPNNSANLIPTVWNVLVYGAAGDNATVIQNALINYILTNSLKTQDRWVTIFPDIFKHTEFVIIPEWKQYSIPNRTLEAGIYSPIVNIQDTLALLVNAINTYPTAHINANASVMAQPYKSLSLAVVGGPDNKNNLFKIKDVFIDFIGVSSTSIDFNRMSQATQQWAIMLETMLYVAETMGDHTDIPANMSRVVRNGIMYLVGSYQNINYLVAAKVSF